MCPNAVIVCVSTSEHLEHMRCRKPLVVHVADIRTCVLHPASSTHRQLTEQQLIDAGVTPGLIRLSVGLEDVDDIIEDLKQALDKASE